MKTFCIILTVAALAGPTLHAQIVNDGATNTLSNVTTNITGSVTVGTNGSFTLLVLSDSALVTNGVHVVIGANTTAKSNEVRLISPTARWLRGGSTGSRLLIVGSNGASSRLVISNGALVANNNAAYIGFGAPNSNNVAVVTGTGSIWDVGAQLSVGQLGVGNQLIVANGGLVRSSDGRIGSIGSNNLAVVTGAGSHWTNQTDFYVGVGGAGNRLLIENGGRLSDRSGYISANATCRSNEVVVTGGGSAWNNELDLTVGPQGDFNRLVISNGGWVVNNSALVGASANATNNEVLVTGANSTWSNRADLILSLDGSRNRLEVSNGGLVTSQSGIVGNNASASDNAALVTGPGSRWNIQTDFTLGLQGSRNGLVVSNGAAMVSGGNAYIGAVPGANNNVAVVTGSGSVWSNLADLYMEDSVGNRLEVTAGGRLVTSNASIGFSSTANGNRIVVTGAGSTWSNRASLAVGEAGSGNTLIASNGATIHLGIDGMIGGTSSALSNSVFVTDPGTSLTAIRLAVGSNGPFSRLIVTNGARVNIPVGSLTVGSFSSGDSNLVMVTGSGSLLSNRSSLYLGLVSDGNRLVVTNGGEVRTRQAWVALNGDRNEAVVTGAGSLWSIQEALDVGGTGDANRLIVSDNGTVAVSNRVIVGEFFVGSAPDHRVTVDGGTLRVANASGTGVLDVRRGTNVFNAGLIEADQLIVTNRGANFPSTEFNNSTSVPIPNPGSVSSTIAVAGLAGVVTKVTVTLSGLSHTSPDDLDILLVSPAGQKVMLMSDAGGGSDINTTLNFDDAASQTLPDSTAIAFFGPYRPTDYEPGETLPSPAPPGPYSVTLSSFNGSSANGNWRLHVVDDSFDFGGLGSLSSWRLRIATDGGPALDRGAFEFNGGALITRGAVISNNAPFLVGASGNTPAVWDVRAGPSNHLVSGDFIVGRNSSFNQLLLTNGALLTNSSSATLGGSSGAHSNSATLTGAGSRWVLDDGVFVGGFGSVNRLVVSNGARLVTASSSTIGHESFSTNNEAVVTGAGSSWISGPGQMFVGYGGRGNRLLISDGGLVTSSYGTLGNLFADSSNNLAVVTGAGSVWSNSFELRVGNVGPANRLVVSNGGAVFASDAVYVGVGPASLRNRVVVDGGTLRVTDDVASAFLEIRRGTNVLNAGLIEADILRMTNAQGFFEFNGGTLSVKSSRVSVGTRLTVGNGVSPATLLLAGNGTHDFSGTFGVSVSSNATLTGNGTVAGSVQVLAGGRFVPGASIGRINLNFAPFLHFGSATIMEISKDGAALTNDQVRVTGPDTLIYDGTLTVTKLGPTALAAGDNFKLFDANSYIAFFQNMNLPPLSAGLAWTNKLVVDGSIEVVVAPPQPGFANISLSGTNVVISGTNGMAGADYTVLAATNVTLPLSNWVSIATNQFDAGGAFSFTNSIETGIPQRFFQLRTP